MSPAVWITGLGAVSSAGVGSDALAGALEDSRPRLERLEELGGLAAGRLPNAPRSPAARRLDRSGAFFLAAAEEAWAKAGLSDESDPRGRRALVEGSSLGSMADLLDTAASRRRPRPSHLVRFMAGAGGSTFAQEHGILGPVVHVSAGSVSGMCAIGEAVRWIRNGRADVVVAGGADCPLHPSIADIFRSAGVLSAASDEPPCRPFDHRRCGTVLGEGAGVLILESESHARRRGAEPLALITGYGFASEDHGMTAPDPEGTGLAVAIRAALREARIGSVAWIKAHGTGTPLGDAAECRALARVFGDELSHRPVASLKSRIGHCLGASGAVETVAVVLAGRRTAVPATLGTRESDPELPSCDIVTEGRRADPGDVLALAESFGGRCAALLVRPVPAISA